MPNKREEFIKELYADVYDLKQDMYVYDMDKDIDLNNFKFNAEVEIEIGGIQYANNI